MQNVLRRIAPRLGSLEKMLSGAFGNHNHGMTPVPHPFFQGAQKAVLALERKRHFRHQGEIDFLADDGRPRRNEAGVAAHQFDQGNPVHGIAGLDVGPTDDFGCLLEGRRVAE